MTTENAAPKQPRRQGGKPFAPGQSGNPRGKPAGARNKTTITLEKLLEGEAEAVTRQCIEMAKGGDGMAMRLVMERIAPLRRGRPVQFTLPDMNGSADLVQALGGVLRAVASGQLTPDEGGTVASILDTKRRAHETAEFDERLTAIEKATATSKR